MCSRQGLIRAAVTQAAEKYGIQPRTLSLEGAMQTLEASNHSSRSSERGTAINVSTSSRDYATPLRFTQAQLSTCMIPSAFVAWSPGIASEDCRE